MSDLIDLNSPGTKGVVIAKLASPLIPVPADCSEHKGEVSENLSNGKRDSLENNPFDLVLHKTTEYVQKKNDPFEVALERALKKKSEKNRGKTGSIDLAEFSPKKSKNRSKLNRTLDESLIKRLQNNRIINRENINMRNSSEPINAVSEIDNCPLVSLSDLTDRLNKLKTNSSNHSSLINGCIPTDQKSLVIALERKQSELDGKVVDIDNKLAGIRNKLIDVDVFTPDESFPNEHCRSSVSDTSSDSVFLEDGSRLNRSILREAKALARTFEELAQRTSSASVTDDLINSSRSWTSELVPAFEDEEVVENLIELPGSPSVAQDLNKDGQLDQENLITPTNELAHEKGENEKRSKDSDSLAQYLESTAPENKIAAANLLFDLRRLVEAENNREASKLLENLEKVLGVECKNNAELLATYLNTTGNLSKSSQMSNSSFETTRDAEQSAEGSQEENLTGGRERLAEAKAATDTEVSVFPRTPKVSKLRRDKTWESPNLRLSLDLDTKGKKVSGILRRSMSTRNSPIEKAPSPLTQRSKTAAPRVCERKKLALNDPSVLDTGKINGSEREKLPDIEKGRRSMMSAVLEQEKRPAIVDAVKAKLKKKTNTENGVNKKGPMKALLPIGNMHKRESVNGKVGGVVTPPRSRKITSNSTPITESEYATKKSPRTKPVASSTPDAHSSKAWKPVPQALASSSKKRTLSCDISPVTGSALPVGVSKESPKRSNKVPSPKKLTPKRRPAESNIPKMPSSPLLRRTNSSFETRPGDQRVESPQRLKTGQTPGTPSKRPLEKTQQSPLRDSNKMSPRVKPLNLITKLRRHSHSTNSMEKENNYT